MRCFLLLLPLTLTAVETTQDSDGRIPWRDAPAEVGERDRWRYLPPERIVPGGFFDRFGVTTFAFPIVFSEEAIGTGVGVGIVDTDFRAQDRAESAAAFASVTTEGQTEGVIAWRRALKRVRDPSGGVFLQEDNDVQVATGFRRTLTRRFYGLGPDTTPDDETSYTDQMVFAGATIEGGPLAPLPNLIARVGLRGEFHRLDDGRVQDVPSALNAFPTLTDEANDRGEAVSTVGLRWEARDSPANPYRGGSLDVAVEAWGDTGTVGTAAGTWALSLPSPFHDGGAADLAARGREENPPTDVLAVGVQVQQAGGDVPFYGLPSLGGSKTLRGYLADRFVDRAAWHASVEWRTWILPRGFNITKAVRIERVGLAPFWDVGTVAPRLGDLPKARLHHNPGLGFRFAFERAMVLRLDIARSAEQTGVNLDMGMAF